MPYEATIARGFLESPLVRRPPFARGMLYQGSRSDWSRSEAILQGQYSAWAAGLDRLARLSCSLSLKRERCQLRLLISIHSSVSNTIAYLKTCFMLQCVPQLG